MRKSIFALAALAALSICACNKMEEKEEKGGDEPKPKEEEVYTGDVNFSVTLCSNGSETKVTYEHDKTNNILSTKWEDGDKIYIAGEKDGYVGVITMSTKKDDHTATFTGTLKSWSEAQKLHLYYLGTGTPSIQANASCALSLAGQDGNPENIAHRYGYMHAETAGSISPSASITLGSLSLSSMISVLYMNFSNVFKDGSDLQCTGVYSDCVLDLCSGQFTGWTKNEITLSSSGNEYYLALIPKDGEKQTLVTEGIPVGDPSSTAKAEMNPFEFKSNYFYTSSGKQIEVKGRILGVGVYNTLSPVETGLKLSNNTITNMGNIYSYIRAVVVGNWVDDMGRIVAEWSDTEQGEWEELCTADGWFHHTDGYYYYKYPVEGGKATGTKLFESYTLKNAAAPIEGTVLSFNVAAQTVEYDEEKAKVTFAWGKDVADRLELKTD